MALMNSHHSNKALNRRKRAIENLSLKFQAIRGTSRWKATSPLMVPDSRWHRIFL